jgi:deazaflavin-dependent oxidoreductase (nitroreductase family)
MTIIMVGATSPSASWPVAALLGLGALTGLTAGLAVGAVTWLFLPALVDAAPQGGTWVNCRVLGVLRSPAHALLSARLLDLQYQGRRSHREYALPVQYAHAAEGDNLVVCPGHPQTKSWWRNFSRPQPVRLTVRGERRSATAQVVRHDIALLRSYRARWPKVRVTADDPVVLLILSPRRAAEPRGS